MTQSDCHDRALYESFFNFGRFCEPAVVSDFMLARPILDTKNARIQSLPAQADASFASPMLYLLSLRYRVARLIPSIFPARALSPLTCSKTL